MKSHSIRMLVMLLSFTFLVSATGYAKEHGDRKFAKGDFKERREKKMEEIHKQLGLTQEQETKLKGNREAHRSRMKANYEQIKAKKDQIAEELKKSDFNEEKVKQLQEELKASKAKAEDDRLEGIIEVRKVLTPEQFQKFNELREDHQDRPMKDDDK